MKTRHQLLVGIAGLLGMIPAAWAGGSLACGGSLEVTRDGQPVPVASEHVAPLTEDFQALLESSTVDATSWGASPEKWQAEANAPTRLFYRAPNGHGFDLRFHGMDVVVEEMLFSFPANRDHWYVLVRNGTGIHAYAKFDPRLVKKIARYPEIGLADKAPYRSWPDPAP